MATVLGGGQLREKEDPSKCFGYEFSPAPDDTVNYEDSQGDKSTRLQWLTCQEVDDPNFDIEKLKLQLWSGQIPPGTEEQIVLRNVCTEKVIRKVRPDCDHSQEKLYDGQPTSSCSCKAPEHFDVELVDRNQCTDMMSVNNCVFNVYPPVVEL